MFVFVIGCATTTATTPTPQQEKVIDEAGAELVQCLKKNIVSVDDKMSDASTIAKSLTSLCHRQFYNYNQVYAQSKNTDPDVQWMFHKKAKEANFELALTCVLQYRNSNKGDRK
jgi:hypothetical protein